MDTIEEHKIYLLRTNFTQQDGKPVYKIGRTTQERFNRLRSYPKEYHFIYARSCIDSISIEKQILRIFNNKYTKVIGNEFFSGDEIEMIQYINNIIDEEKSSHITNNSQISGNNKELLSSLFGKPNLNNVILVNNNNYNNSKENNKLFECRKCKKNFGYKQSRWFHEKKCKINNNNNYNIKIEMEKLREEITKLQEELYNS
jgi:hypothetical protein